MTCFSHRHLLITAFFSHYSPAYLYPCSSTLSHTTRELTSAYIYVPECRSRKIRGGEAALRCAPPYFDLWLGAYISAFFCRQHIAHEAPATGCENNVVFIQLTAQFADKLKRRVEVLMKGQYFCIIKSWTSIMLPYIGCCWTLLWIPFEQINGVVVSSVIACRKETTVHAIDLFGKETTFWLVCSTTHHPRLWLELGLISSIPWSDSRSHESWVMFH